MYKKLIVNDTPHETRVALIEDGTLTELFIERQTDFDIAGNIYKGRVQRVLPGMQAAFVDIGLQQAAFIYVADVLNDDYLDLAEMFTSEIQSEGNDGDAGEKTEPREAYTQRQYKIEELITEGQELMVHVAKSPIGTKGARITSYISLPGRFLVLMPYSSHIGISRRIESETERLRLKNMIIELRDNNYGYIARTASEGIGQERLASEMRFLTTLWEDILKRFRSARAPSLLHQELDVTLRAVRDLLIHEAEKLVIDSKSGYDAVLNFIDNYMPVLKESVELYEGREPIFDAYNLEGDISRALKKKVWLKSGGYIVIEHTEALVAVDVNTGRYVGKHNLEETILKTNLEAVKEIAYQLRLRDIGGIIIIDFIDMAKKSNQEKVFNALREALRKDRSKTHVLPMSDMGLIQMTRKRNRKSLNGIMCEPCFYCDGEGGLISKQSICHNLYREVIRESHDMMGRRLTLRVNPEIAEVLHGEENRVVESIEKTIGKQVVIYPSTKLHIEEFDILETYGSLPNSEP
jgi:ribonuclease G